MRDFPMAQLNMCREKGPDASSNIECCCGLAVQNTPTAPEERQEMEACCCVLRVANTAMHRPAGS